MAIRFEIRTGGTRGPRIGCLTTPHGCFPTPLFMPVGTLATVKTLSPAELHDAGVQMILANAYHLYLRPGIEVLSDLGGLHRFMGWEGGLLTDSGGFQVFSLADLRTVDDEGVTFRSHLDGSEHRFTPERVMEIQEVLGSDIAMPLDDLPPYPSPLTRLEDSVRRTSAWLRRAVAVKRRVDQALFGIVQGGTNPDLRRLSAREVVSLDLPGYAIGGLSVGEPLETMLPALEAAISCLPDDRPRYLMGVGSPDYLVESVARGVDLFDCVLPTRMARHGAVYTWHGRMVLRHARYRRDPSPIDPECDCRSCRAGFSRAYLRHLLKAGEVLGIRLATLHNIHFMMAFMERMRESIAEGQFETFRREAWRRFGKER